MPKDEFDFEDPFELNGMALLTHEDTTNEMAECFIEEFLRMGYNSKQVLALFRNPQYLGPHLVLQKRGETFVHELIAEIFARWGRPVAQTSKSAVSPISESAELGGVETQAGLEARDTAGSETCATNSSTDPLGGPIPDLPI